MTFDFPQFLTLSLALSLSLNHDSQSPRILEHNTHRHAYKYIDMKERLERLGIHPKDIPKALIIFNSMLWVEWLGVLTFCCAVRPVRQIAKKTNVLRRIRDK